MIYELGKDRIQISLKINRNDLCNLALNWERILTSLIDKAIRQVIDKTTVLKKL